MLKILIAETCILHPLPNPSFHKTRLAPTPSGYLHLGNALSFLLTRQLAQESGARILLRIDDMDRERVRPEYVQDVFDTLRFLEIRCDEGPADATAHELTWSQRHRLADYERLLDRLAREGKVYACTCSRAEIARHGSDGYPGTCRSKKIALDTPGAAWRLRTVDAGPLSVLLRSGDSIAATLPATQRDFIVRKKDGFPAYQLCSLSDDVRYGIDLVVRGEDLWDSTLAQLYLARELGLDSFLKTVFVHHSLVLAENGEKLSKSAGATSVHAQYTASRKEVLERLRSQLDGVRLK